jgi:poly(3-hydroxybutyrate) depolymerase
MLRKTLLLAAALLLFASPAVSYGQLLPAGPQVLTFHSEVDDTDQPYALYLPRNYDASRKYPLVVSLHGAGSNHRLNLRRVFGRSNAPGETDVEASRYFPEWRDVDFIVVSPLARGTMGYQGVAEKDVLDVLADVKRRFSVDEDRTYLTGLSMGGGGTLWIGLTRPDIWAAIAPVCPAPPAGTDAFAPNVLNVPVRIFHGDADPVVPAEMVRGWVARLQELGTQVEYTEYPGVGHDSWVPAYADGQIFEWFSRFRRDPHPERVRLTSDRYRYVSAYWVEMDALTPGTPASIDVRFSAANRLEATTSGLDGFTLRLAGHPRFTAGGTLELRIDGQRVRVPAAETVSVHRQPRGWRAGKHELPVHAKRPGAEGPISAAIADRHIYVYGTGGEPSQAQLAARRAQAERAANWSVDRGPFLGRVMVFPRAIADRDVRPSDLESANLVLFGTRETNTLIERFADRLPLHLSSAADGYGLIYVAPLGDRYVVVSSGLPWWEAGDAAAAPGRLPFTNAVSAFGLMALGDYLLFRENAENPIAAGRFDAQWRLPRADAERLRATGVVSVDGAATALRQPAAASSGSR